MDTPCHGFVCVPCALLKTFALFCCVHVTAPPCNHVLRQQFRMALCFVLGTGPFGTPPVQIRVLAVGL